MKHKVAMWASLIAGLLWVVVGLRDTYAPGFFNMSPSVKGKLDIALEFATGAVFLLVAVLFQRSRQQLASKTK
ncbi:MAG TPA: hypothetical protein VE977_01535 [Pyrinomonadaceae bacterium]|nr:hypothetical protein [Pyrinomonadaceae bacterium]